MFRLKKLLWIILIFWIVFFIICDEKWIEIEWDKDHIVLHQTVNISTNKDTDNKWSIKKVRKNSDIVRIYPGFANPKNLRASDWLDLEYLAKLEEEKVTHKNSDIVRIYPSFENPKNLRASSWLDLEYLAKLEEEKRLEEERMKAQEKVYTWPSLISMNDDTISSVFQRDEPEQEIINPEPQKNEQSLNNTEIHTDNKTQTNNKTTKEADWLTATEIKQPSWIHDRQALNLSKWKINTSENTDKILYKNSNLVKIYPWFLNPQNLRYSAWIDEEFLAKQEEIKTSPVIVSLSDNETGADIHQQENSEENYSNTDEKVENITTENTWFEYSWNQELIQNNPPVQRVNDNKNNNEKVSESEPNTSDKETNLIKIDKPDLSTPSIDLSKWKEVKIHTTKIEKYNPTRNVLLPKKGVSVKQNFIVENNIEESPSNWLPDPMMESLLENEEIDIDVLESENDEFLQKVFDATKDTSVMNLIVENYLNEYQFVKAKKFIEDLPSEYRDELNAQLNLRVVFNSFALTSKTTNESLDSLVKDYFSKREISEEDKNRYLWVVALMDRNYDRFFELANSFTLESHKNLASKLQWYKDQIAKQMWMPDYYFDTLVALELFNQGLFQPAKVLALYSLQQNSNYILPYQILAYANFLTNSRDTSIEYLRKLIDIDPNNSEKYRFLMWIAYYWDEKYQQSVVMLSLIKDNKLRLDAERYLVLNYIILDQKNKLITIRNKLLWYDNLVASDFYTYFYEAFYRPFSEWKKYDVYSLDAELANKMIRVCSIKLSEEEKAVCNYWMIGKNIALWEFNWLEESLLKLVTQYPQWYLYQALWEYYINQWDVEKAKAYLLKAVSMTKNTTEVIQIKKLLEETI